MNRNEQLLAQEKLHNQIIRDSENTIENIQSYCNRAIPRLSDSFMGNIRGIAICATISACTAGAFLAKGDLKTSALIGVGGGILSTAALYESDKKLREISYTNEMLRYANSSENPTNRYLAMTMYNGLSEKRNKLPRARDS